MHKRLFIPGPVEVERDVLEKMSMAMIGHRTKEASVLQKDISDKLRKVLIQKRRFYYLHLLVVDLWKVL